MNEKVRNVIFALFVIACIVAYVVDKANEAKEHSSGSYEQYEAEHYAEKEKEEEEARVADLYDSSINYEDILYEPYEYEGQNLMIEGPVAEISILNDSTGSPSFVDVGEAYPSTYRISVVVWEEHYDDVAEALNAVSIGDIIFVEGYIEMYDGVPQIEVTDPLQIQIL